MLRHVLAVLALWTLSAQALTLKRRAMQSGLGSQTALTQQQVDGIRSLLNQTADKSWEIGAHAEALTEFLYPDLSPFASASNSRFASPNPSVNPFPSLVCDIAGNVISQQPWGQWQLIQDASAADPASVGPAVILANWTMGEGQYATVGGRNQSGVGGAAEAQVWALLQQTPRASSGAISHRVESVQLWSDFIYMAPPFFAYYGLMAHNDSLIQLAYDQIRLYRQSLQDPQTKLWRHIYIPGGGNSGDSDPGLWATGNGWVSGGILRVLATIENSSNSTIVQAFSDQAGDLASWTKEVVDAAWTMPRNGGLFHNYMDVSSSFTDGASTAMLVASTYRLALMANLYSALSSSKPASSSLANAEASYQALTGNNNRHLSSSGVLSPVTDPMTFSSQLASGKVSPEGEAFVLLMESARRDWIADGGKIDSSAGNAGGGGTSSSAFPRAPRSTALAIVGLATLAVILSS
ncbi:hypothetical protein BMF94_0922 [Rhodotorula taiwanensis]|uniref:Uncharacterized protein n=1 Tax=Rhodotorula taiwanensis TaxID=741276 RepID=A0A2S5BGE7_9BASI|nr:hypothetical protein BMF94_0922 [Rhodotorula taiwanensis]